MLKLAETRNVCYTRTIFFADISILRTMFCVFAKFIHVGRTSRKSKNTMCPVCVECCAHFMHIEPSGKYVYDIHAGCCTAPHIGTICFELFAYEPLNTSE